MLVQPHTAPWHGEEGRRQARFGVENACLLAMRFAKNGCDVILLDFVWSYTIELYKDQLRQHKPKIVLLMPSLNEILRRNQARGWLPAHEVEMLYAEMRNFTDFDEKIDNTAISVEELAPRLAGMLDSR
jgi:hypothetical protein